MVTGNSAVKSILVLLILFLLPGGKSTAQSPKDTTAPERKVNSGVIPIALRGLGSWQHDRYKVDPYLRAAVALQAMGKDRAEKALEALSKRGNVSVFILCRMLFTKKEGKAFRRPALGGAAFLKGTTYTDWPLEPITIVDGVPFMVVAGGYILAGRPELPLMYLRYCLSECMWNPQRFHLRSRQEKRNALSKLLASLERKRGCSDQDRTYFASQIQ